MRWLALLSLSFSLLCSCASQPEAPAGPVTAIPEATDIQSYWYPHGAEISRYALSQGRYGNTHAGDAVLIFVTEPFDPLTQVKSDAPERDQATPVLKLNATRSFTTGVYPYTAMTSAFAPISQPVLLKASCGVQEWCGQVFTQLNRWPEHLQLRQYSYFQSEGDTDTKLPLAQTEDGLWLRIRLAPETLPTGSISFIPSLVYPRFAHVPVAASPATATLQEALGGLRSYRLQYTELQRTVEITFSAAFPHLIESWSETYPEAPGREPVTTTARRPHTRMLPYWAHNKPADGPWRETIGLPQ